MGAYGSSRWGSVRTRHTVDESLSLPLAYFKGIDFTQRRVWRAETSWKSLNRGTIIARAAWKLDTTDQAAPYVELTYLTSGLHVTRVYLQSSPCNYGGVRWWMICPQCARRVTAVHLPPYRGYTRFLCRHCHDLSYTSAQTAHDNDRGSYAGLKMLLDANNRLNAAYDVLMKARSHSKKAARAWRQIEKLEGIANGAARQAQRDLKTL